MDSAWPLKSLTVVSHVRTTGPLSALERYLVPRVRRLLVIEHPLVHTVPARSRYRLYVRGDLTETGEREVSLPEVIRLIHDAALTVAWVLRMQRGHVYIGLGALNAWVGLVLRVLGCADRSIFWVIDYSPRRFGSSCLNTAFHLIDDMAALRCDETWNLTTRMQEAHVSTRHASLLRHRRNVQKLVPIGLDIPTSAPAARHPHRLIFVGHVLERQGLQLAVAAIPMLTARYPDIELLVVGDGPHLPAVRRLARDLGVDSALTFAGFVKTDDDLRGHLLSASIGLAPYLPVRESATFYADPGKLKLYLGAGLPICLTSVPPIAVDLVAHGCAVVVEPTAGSIAQGVISLIDDQHELEQRRVDCLSYASAYRWERIFDGAFGAR